MKTIRLNNGIEMPMIGFGVYKIEDPITCRQCVLDALQAGYRMIDTAPLYHNEQAVGMALQDSGLDRKEVFVVSKVWIDYAGFDKARQSIDISLKNLNLDYVDLMLVHQPFGDVYGTYRALIWAMEEGLTRSIGVSNFYPDRLLDLILNTGVIPSVNQVETNLFHQQIEAHKLMDEYGIVHQAWSPLAKARPEFMDHPVLLNLAAKYHKSVAQIYLKNLLQRNISIIPKSSHKARIQENINLFDFTLSPEDMDLIASLDQGKSLFYAHTDLEAIKRLISRESHPHQ